jgi:lysozyme family protein
MTPMSDFNIAVKLTLQHEGGYVDNPNDAGGATNMGIEQRDLPNIPIRDLTVQQAVAYYQERYWKQFYSQIASQDIANKLFDMGVLFVVGEAAYLLQRALNFPPAQWTKVFDAATLLATNDAKSADLLGAYRVHLHAHALNLANASPNDRVFLMGWLNRINS